MGVCKLQDLEAVTLGHIRAHGCRDLLIYCEAVNCNHSSRMRVTCLRSADPPVPARFASVVVIAGLMCARTRGRVRITNTCSK
jgi:hypothetical protein